MADKKVNILIAAKQRVSGVLNRIKRGLRSLGRAAVSTQGMIAGAVAAAGLVQGARASIQAISKQINAERRLEGVLRASGNAAGFSAEQLKARAAALQEATTFGDEAIIGMQAQLATFGNIAGENFNRATEAALDMSAVFDQSLRQSARQLGQALAEPEAGLTRLRRQGVVFTDQQKEMIQTFAESGRLAEAQAAILNKLDSAFGGTAKAIAEGPVGAIQQAQNSIGDLVEQVGAALAPTVAKVATAISDVAEGFIPSLTAAIKGAAQFIFQALGFVGQAIEAYQVHVAKSMAAVSFAFNRFGELAGIALNTALLAVVQFKNQAIHFFTETIPSTLTWFLDNWKDIFKTLFDFTKTVFINLADNIADIIQNIPALIRGKVDLSDLWTPITEGFKSSLSELPEIADREMGGLEKQLAEKVGSSAAEIGKQFNEQLGLAEQGVRDRSGVPQFLQQLAEQGLAGAEESTRKAMKSIQPTTTPAAAGGSGGDSGGGTIARGRGRGGIDAIEIGRQFRGLSDRFRAGVGVKPPEQQVVDQAKVQTKATQKQTKAIEMLTREFKSGGVRTVRASLSR